MAKYTPIPAPTDDPTQLRLSVEAIKQAFEELSRQRKNVTNAAVTWQDLVNLGWIKQSDVPSK